MKTYQRVIRIKIRCSHHRDLVGSGPFNTCVSGIKGFPNGSAGKETAYQCRRCGFSPWVGKIPWSRKWQPTPVLLVHGQRNLADYSPWGHKELDTTEATEHMHSHVPEADYLAGSVLNVSHTPPPLHSHTTPPWSIIVLTLEE